MNKLIININTRSDNGQVNTKSHHDVLPLKKFSDDKTKNVMIVGDSKC